jgi:hypothetical protein
MAEIVCQIMCSEKLMRERGGAYREALRATKLPARSWHADSYELPENVLQEACDRAERTVLAFDQEEWIASVDWETGTFSITGDIDPASSLGRLNHLSEVVDSLFRLLQPRFAWADFGGSYPRNLINDVLRLEFHWLFWLNYYGSEYLAKYGRAFFQQAPFENVEILGERGAKCLTGVAPGMASGERISALSEYFAVLSPRIVAYGR